MTRLCQLLRGDEPDAKARFFAASHLAMMTKAFKDEGDQQPAPLLQVRHHANYTTCGF